MIKDQNMINALKDATANYAENDLVLQSIDNYLKELGCNDISYYDNYVKANKFKKECIQALKPAVNEFYDIYVNQYDDANFAGQDVKKSFFNNFTVSYQFWNQVNSVPVPDFSNRDMIENQKVARDVFKKAGSEYIGSFVETINKDQNSFLTSTVAQSFAQRWIDDNFDGFYQDYLDTAKAKPNYHVEDYFMENIDRTIYPLFRRAFEGKKEEEKNKLLERLKQDLSYMGYPNSDVNQVISKANNNANILNVYVEYDAETVLETFFEDLVKGQKELTENVLEDIKEGGFYVHVQSYLKSKLNKVIELSKGYPQAYNVLRNRASMENFVDSKMSEMYADFKDYVKDNPDASFDDYLNEIDLINLILSLYDAGKAREYYLNRFVDTARDFGYSNDDINVVLRNVIAKYESELYNFAKLGDQMVERIFDRYLSEQMM